MNFKPGKVIKIELSNSMLVYGFVISDPIVAFSKAYKTPQTDWVSVFKSPSFTICVMKYAHGKNGWAHVAQTDIAHLKNYEPTFYMYDNISKKFSTYKNNVESPSTKGECLHLECAAVWDKTHIEDRLLALSENRECKWVKSMSAESQV